MRYASIRNFDISNGEGIGVSLFVQGCPFHCKGCFNKETWDFNGGEEFTDKVRTKFLKLIDRPQVKRVSILGGEPLNENNIVEVIELITEIKEQFPDKTIWVYTGFCIEQLLNQKILLSNIDVLVDGPYIEELRDLTLKWRGSSNQRVIDVKETLKQGEVVLYCD